MSTRVFFSVHCPVVDALRIGITFILLLPSLVVTQQAPYYRRPRPEWGAPQDRLSGFTEDPLKAPPRGVPMSCYDRLGKPQRCLPPFVNAAYNMEVETTNTCGSPPLQFCRQTGATGATQECDICDSRSTSKSHPPRFLNDFWSENLNQTWWQSTTMLQGVHTQSVNLTLDLHKTFEVTYIRLRFRTSVPESFAIYKRNCDDCPWVPYQYYSASCKSTYGVPHRGYVTKENEKVALCTDEFSDISPLTNANVPFSTLESRPSRDRFNESMELQDWVTATAVRITLDKLNTFGDEVYGDPKVLRSYYYAISDLSVGARCKCNGHASHCVMSTGEGQEARLVCQCEHFTDGPDCERCLPFYQDRPWEKATDSNANVCRQCQCNGLSNRCVFDDELYRRTASGGRCLDCQKNTAGPHCEECKTGFYRNSRTSECVSCGCNAFGSVNLRCDASGRCECKPGVTGQKCDRCLPGHFGFSRQGCQPCSCDERGSVNNNPSCDVVTGECRCKSNVEGDRCDKCLPGFFNLETSNEFGCISCFCFGHSSICSSAPEFFRRTILSDFRSSADGWTVTGSAGSDAEWNFDKEELRHGDRPSLANVYFISPRRFSGDQRFSYGQKLKFRFRVTDGRPQASREDIVIKGKKYAISIPIFEQGNPSPTTEMQRYSFKLHEHPNFGWSPRLSHAQFVELLSGVEDIRIRATYTKEGVGVVDDIVLESATHRSGGDIATYVEKCTCPKGYVGQYCEDCAPGFRRVVLNGGPTSSCVPCTCNGHSPTCDVETGRCICRDNTEGANCQRCARGFIGDARRGHSDNCQPCPCPEGTACVISNVNGNEQIVCAGCPVGYVGPRCDMCGEGFYGDLTGCRPDQIGISNHSSCTCRPCRCNNNVDPNAIGNCDGKTGACLKCVGGTDGEHCQSCLPGYFGVAVVTGRPGNCTLCDCDRRGTRPTSTGERRCGPNGQCRCIDHVVGRRCDQAETGYRWWREGVDDLADPEDALRPRPLVPGGDGEPNIGLPVGGFRVIDPLTGRIIDVPSGGVKITMIPPGGGGYRVVDPITGKEIPIPDGVGVYVVDATTGRIIGVPVRVDDGRDGLVDPGSKILPPGAIIEHPTSSGIPPGGPYGYVDPVTGKVIDLPEGAAIITIPPGGGGYRIIHPVTGEEINVPAEGTWVIDPTTGRIVGVIPRGKANPDDASRPFPTLPPGCIIQFPDVAGGPTIPSIPGGRFRPVIPCDCDLVGSLGSSCSDDGQCLCKPGVVGKKCGNCAKGFINLSVEGCQPCNCDRIGSLSATCDERGRCICLENVVGLKCDKCKKNMFGLSSSSRRCFACPVCYNLIDDRVKQHRQSVDQLKHILSVGGDEMGSKDNITNEQMDKLVEEVDDALNNLQKHVFAAQSPSQSRFSSFRRDMSSIASTLDAISKSRTLMRSSLELSARESRLLEEALVEIERLVSSLDDRQDALKDLLSDADSLDDGRSSKSVKLLSEMGEEAANLARGHSNSATTIIDTAEKASNVSGDAALRLDESLLRVESVSNELARLRNNAELTKERVSRMTSKAKDGRQMALRALEEARQMARDVKGHQPGISEVINEKIAETMRNAKKIARVSNDLRNSNKKILDLVAEAGQKGNRVYEEALAQQQKLDALLEEAVDAKMKAATARDQIKPPEGILGEAQRTLETLADFDNTVTSSKLETKAALSRIKEIQMILDEVDLTLREINLKWRRGRVRKMVDRAVNQSKEAESLSSLLSINASSLVTETSTTSKMATEVKLRSQKLISHEFQATETQLLDMENTVEADTKKANGSISAGTSTRQSWQRGDVKAEDALSRLEALLDDLARLGDPSTVYFDDISKGLNEAEMAIQDLGLDETMARLEIGARQQEKIIAEYEEDYHHLEQSVRHVEEIREDSPPHELERPKKCGNYLEKEASRRR